MPETEQQIDVRKIEPKRKHPTIFETFDDLDAGETFVIINDHDPKPLKYEMAAERADQKFTWKYLEEGPDVWKVRIGKTA
ncbi:MAG: DUF2249 domain-containing protein [Fodinibius sp.]|nr:DUF2249 domain-containing protein [Fodinibius sp.]